MSTDEDDYDARATAHAGLIAARLSTLLPDGYSFGYEPEPILHGPLHLVAQTLAEPPRLTRWQRWTRPLLRAWLKITRRW